MKETEGLISRNITVTGKRTSVRLENQMWRALRDIAMREKCGVNDLCTLIAQTKKPNISLTSSIRIFIMMYYKAAATEDGHLKAGHGGLDKMRVRARVCNDPIMRPAQGRVANAPYYDSVSSS